MKSITKLKDQARQFEQKENWQGAIDAYLQVLEAAERKEGEVELPVLNRVGDLYLRVGRSDEAYDFYARAVDRYADVGLYNNAIALCSKALRYLPHRIAIYRRLGQLSAAQGFLPDARRWFLEFAERAFALDRVDEAFEALEEFAALSEDPEIRELLGRQLHEHGRDADAVEQLQQAHGLRLRAGQAEEAAALEQEILSLDPDAVVGGATAMSEVTDRDGGLPYLDSAPAPAVESVEPEVPRVEVEQFEEAAEEDVGPIETLPLETPAAIAGFDEDDEAAPPADAGGLELESMEQAAGFGSGSEAAAELERLVPDGPEDEEPPSEHERVEPLPILEGTELDEDEEALPALEGTALDQEEDVGPDDDEDIGEPLPILEGTEVGDDEEPEPLPVLEDTAVDEGAERAPDTDDDDPDQEFAGDDLSFLSGIDFGLVTEPEEAGREGASPGGSPGTSSPQQSPADEGRSRPAAPVAELPDADSEIARIREIAASGAVDAAANAFMLTHDELAAGEALDEAGRVLEAWIEVAPDDVRAYQCGVEDAARRADPPTLVSAYLALAECLRRTGSEVKASAVYQQVLDLDPGNEEAAAALGAAHRSAGSEAYVDLQSLVGDADGEVDDAAAGTGSVTGMLSQLRAKTADDAVRDDSENHYDLGLAFKEMGLVDEAIGEFQTALRGGEERLKVYEELGQCYMLKEQYNVALKVLARALQLPRESDDDLLGVYYHLARCHEELGERSEARAAYEKIDRLDSGFRDVSQRLSRL